jgi:hypothetical protein
MAAEGVPGDDPWAEDHVDELAELEPAWVGAAAGAALVHGDIRADNVVVDGAGKVWFVDWAHAGVGARWLDLLLMLPSIAMQGGPDPESVWRRSPLSRDVDERGVTAVVACFDGYFTFQSRQPDPPGLPFVRRFQAEQGEVTRRWLQQRLAWER